MAYNGTQSIPVYPALRFNALTPPQNGFLTIPNSARYLFVPFALSFREQTLYRYNTRGRGYRNYTTPRWGPAAGHFSHIIGEFGQGGSLLSFSPASLPRKALVIKGITGLGDQETYFTKVYFKLGG